MPLNTIVSTSKATLPLTVVLVIAALVAACGGDQQLWVAAVCTLVSAWLLEMINIKNVLLRGYSRLTACLFLVLSLATFRLSAAVDAALVQLCFVLCLLFLFPAYQRRRAPAAFFVAFLCLGVASMLFVQVLFLVPFLWLLAATWLQAPSARNFCASLLGLLLPYFFWGTYLFYIGSLSPFVAHFVSLATFAPLCEGLTEPHLLAAIAVIVFFDACALIHYLLFAFNESIKNRMLYSILFALIVVALAFLLLQPAAAAPLLRLLIVPSAAALAHFFTFARARVVVYLFYVFLALVLAATAAVIWNL